MFFCKFYTSCCFKFFQPEHFFAPKQLCWTLDKSHRNAFSRLGNGLQQFLCWKLCGWAILEKYRRCRLFLCFAAIAVLLLTKQFMQLYAFLEIFMIWLPNNWICDIYVKLLHLTYSVIMCEAKFSKLWCEIFKCTWVKR